MPLRDRNTVAMVAEHWGCSAATVHARIADGKLSCLRISGVVRITREQVETFERLSADASDRLTVTQVAALWACSPATVYARIADGTLSCLRLGGMIRVTRQQVEECEARCTSAATGTVAAPEPPKFSTAQGFDAALQRERENAYRRNVASRNSSPPTPRTKDAFQLGQEIGGKMLREKMAREAILERARQIGSDQKRAALNSPSIAKPTPARGKQRKSKEADGR